MHVWLGNWDCADRADKHSSSALLGAAGGGSMGLSGGCVHVAVGGCTLRPMPTCGIKLGLHRQQVRGLCARRLAVGDAVSVGDDAALNSAARAAANVHAAAAPAAGLATHG